LVGSVDLSEVDSLVPFGRDMLLPREYQVRFEGADLPYIVTLEIRLEDTGPACNAMRCERASDGPPVTTAGIRRIPVSRLVSESPQVAAWVPMRDAEGGVVGEEVAAVRDFPAIAAAQREVESTRRRWAMNDDHLRAVARVYREAKKRPGPTGVPAPTAAVKEHFNVSRPTAGRWVMASRDRGFLPPAQGNSTKRTTRKRGER
jgi:hypothetical protein